MKPVAYEGSAPYIFVSYAHKDSDRVFRVIDELAARGGRVWYDDGIVPGSEWPEDIAQHLYGAQMVIAFITPNSMQSENCRREINFALSKEKPFLSVVLEETEMPLGMEMQLAARQSIQRYNFPTWEAFIEKVLKCPDIGPCMGESGSGTYETGSGEAETPRPAAPETASSAVLDEAQREAKLLAVFQEAVRWDEQGDNAKEVEVLLGAVSFAPDSCDLMVKIGRAYRRSGFNQKALEYYEKAQRINPNDPTIYANMGAVYLSVGQYAAAKPYYEKGLALFEANSLAGTQNDRAVANGNYALVLGKLGDIKGAKKHLVIARKAGYGTDRITNICQQLNIKPKSVLKDSFWR